MRTLIAPIAVWLFSAHSAVAQNVALQDPDAPAGSRIENAQWLVAILLMGGLILLFTKHEAAHAWAESHVGWAVLIVLGVPIAAALMLV